jgi:hypothetical protein
MEPGSSLAWGPSWGFSPGAFNPFGAVCVADGLKAKGTALIRPGSLMLCLTTEVHRW